MSINFYLEKRPNKAGENPIRAQVSIRSSVLISTIGYSVNPDVWNGEQVDERLVAAWYKKQKKSDKDAVKVGRGQRKPYVNSKGVTDVTINQELIRIKAHFADYGEGLDHKPSKEELKNQLLIALKKMPEKTTATTGKAPMQKAAASLFDNFDEFTREQGLANQWAYATRCGSHGKWRQPVRGIPPEYGGAGGEDGAQALLPVEVVRQLGDPEGLLHE